MTQVRVEYESMIPRGTDERLDLWEALGAQNICSLQIFMLMYLPHLLPISLLNSVW